MALYLLIGSLIIMLCVLFNKFSQKIGIPMLLGFILLGMAFGTDGLFKIPFEDYVFAEKICSVALIFIMFYGGFGTNWKEARPVAVKSTLLATVGVVLTAGFTGLFCYFVLHIGLLESFLIGAVISSTDAASVFSILRSKKMGLKYNTASMLELESGSNDPCSYMLTAIVLSIMGGVASAGSVAYMVFAQFAYGVGIGVVLALAARFVLRRFKFATAGFDMAFVIGVALLSYALPTLVGGNGYMSVYIVGIILGNTNIKNKRSLVHFFDGITGLMQMLIFFLLGLLSTPSQIPAIIIPAIAIALFLTFVARPLSIISILTPAKCKIRQQLLVSFAGLRGAASIVFAIMATVNAAYMKNDVFHIVFCIVLFSILFQGTLLLPVAKKLKMSDPGADVMKTFSDYSEKVDLHFIKLEINQDHPWLGMAIKDVVLPPDTLVIMILRENKPVIPSGEIVFMPNDTIVLSAQAYQDVNNIILTEQKIEADSEYNGKTISEISPDPDELIIIIIRNNQTIIPRGDTIIEENDLLVLNSAGENSQI